MMAKKKRKDRENFLKMQSKSCVDENNNSINLYTVICQMFTLKEQFTDIFSTPKVWFHKVKRGNTHYYATNMHFPNAVSHQQYVYLCAVYS